jgi:RNase P/RNase MRP subunit POP5
MKPLKPSHKDKKRYLLIKGKDANKKIIEETILDFIGILGFAKASPYPIKNKEKNIIIAINRNMLDMIRTAFFISNKDIKIIKVSGSVSKLKKSP